MTRHAVTLRFYADLLSKFYKTNGLNIIKQIINAGNSSVFYNLYENSNSRRVEKPFTFMVYLSEKVVSVGDYIIPHNKTFDIIFSTSKPYIIDTVVEGFNKIKYSQNGIKLKISDKTQITAMPMGLKMLPQLPPDITKVKILHFLLPIKDKLFRQKYGDLTRYDLSSNEDLNKFTKFINLYLDDKNLSANEVSVLDWNKYCHRIEQEYYYCEPVNLYIDFKEASDAQHVLANGIGHRSSQGFGFPMPFIEAEA